MKWWHSLVSILLPIGVALAPLAQAQIASHPAVSVFLGAAWAIIGHLLPSPLAQK